MNKCYLKQMLTYFSKVYHLREKIKRLKDGRLNPQIETSTISFIVLFRFISRLESFNRLIHWLKNGTVDGFKVAAIDGVEIFESTKKSCEKCLTRLDKQGITHYFHKAVICATVGSDPHTVLGYEMLEPKNDGADKDEGEITGDKSLIRKLYEKFHHFTDIIVADALYCKAFMDQRSPLNWNGYSC